jgi:hypothetical protein
MVVAAALKSAVLDGYSGSGVCVESASRETSVGHSWGVSGDSPRPRLFRRRDANDRLTVAAFGIEEFGKDPTSKSQRSEIDVISGGSKSRQIGNGTCIRPAQRRCHQLVRFKIAVRSGVGVA